MRWVLRELVAEARRWLHPGGDEEPTPVVLEKPRYSRCIRCWKNPPAPASLVCDPACSLTTTRKPRKATT